MFKLFVTVAATFAFASAASAVIIDFQGVAASGVQQAVGNNYIEDGFKLFNPGSPSDAAIVGQPSQNTSGSDYYTWNSPTGNNPITLTTIGGISFNLASLDVGSKGGSAANFNITGFVSGGGTLFTGITGASAFSNVTLNWANLTRVEFSFVSGDFGAIDNLSVNASVPEGGPTLAMLGLTLGGIVLLQRKLSRRATPQSV
jgi:hypothetical protein